jgi:hypothetical protein
LNTKWVGYAIAAESVADNAERQAEEMEEYGGSDLDVLGVRANARPVSSSR